LRDEGLVDARPGVGTVVASRPMRTRRQRQTPEAETTAERIVAMAIEIADTEGLAAVSMRRIAIELGVATMALYRHVRGKNRLLLLMADTIMGRVRFPETRPPGWREQLELVPHPGHSCRCFSVMRPTEVWTERRSCPSAAGRSVRPSSTRRGEPGGCCT